MNEADLWPIPRKDMSISLRQWYAGLAMQGLIIRDTAHPTAEEIAELALEQADAMIAAEQEEK